MSRVLITGSADGLGLMAARQANADGPYDAVIHNAGVGYREPRPVRTDDGLEHVFAINVLAPYLLAGLIGRPGRLVYLSSGMHRGGDPGLTDPQWEHPGAPDDMSLAPVTQAWLAASSDPEAGVTGGYFYHQQPRTVHRAAHDLKVQDRLLSYCAALTGVTL